MSKLCGIGLLLRDSDEYLEVEEVVRDGPAFRSGKVRPSDIVKAVDSVRVGRRHGYALDNVKKLILGPPDTAVTLTLIRSQSEFDVIITRAPPRMSAAHFSSGASSANATAPLVSTASAFAPSAASLHQAPEDLRKSLQRSNSLPVRSAPEHDVRNSGGHFKVQVEYQAKMGHELNLHPGQTVEVTRKHRTGWWEGVAEGGSKGWFPSSVLLHASLSSAQAESVQEAAPARQAHADESSSCTLVGDITKAPGYGAYADRTRHSAARTGRKPPPSDAGAHDAVWHGAGRKCGQDKSGVPEALVQELVGLLRDLKQAALVLRAPARRGPGAPACASGGASRAGGVLDGGKGSDSEVLALEAQVAGLKSRVAAQSREAERYKESCARLQQEKGEALERCLNLQKELEACARERDSKADELESIKQDPQLYLSGLPLPCANAAATAGTPPASSASSAKRPWHASHGSFGDDTGSIDLEEEEEEVDFEAHDRA